MIKNVQKYPSEKIAELAGQKLLFDSKIKQIMVYNIKVDIPATCTLNIVHKSGCDKRCGYKF